MEEDKTSWFEVYYVLMPCCIIFLMPERRRRKYNYTILRRDSSLKRC
jgi:hypothetical protein